MNEDQLIIEINKNTYNQGIEKGIKEGIKQMATKMKNNGMNETEISKISGLTLEQIQKL